MTSLGVQLRLPVLAGLLVAALLTASCQVVGGYDEFERSAPASASPRRRPCEALAISKKPGLHGPNLLRIDDPDATCFWMDETEVTVQQYRQWLADPDSSSPAWPEQWCAVKSGTKPFDLAQLADACAVPKAPGLAEPFGDEQPIRCVDYCEASAFCTWAGKRLCKVADPSDEWQIACSVGFTERYPFDPTLPGGSCNYGQSSCSLGCGPRPAGQEPSCRPAAGYPFDLGGNVREWTDGCFPRGGTIACSIRGGSYLSPQADLLCSRSSDGDLVYTRDPALGFRCCAALSQDERLQLPD